MEAVHCRDGSIPMCTLGWLLLVGTSKHGHIWMSKAGTELTHKAHMFLLRMCGSFSVVAMSLLVLYLAGASYYMCGDSFSSTTVSNFSNPYHGHAMTEWAVIILWAVWIAVGAFFLRRAPAARVAREGEEMSWLESFLKFIYSCCWLCIVAVLSFPSVAYAVVSAIPFNNTLKLSAWWLKFFQYQAALVMVLVDMFITPKAVRFFADAPAFEYPCYLFPSIPLVIMSQHNSYVKLPEGKHIISICLATYQG